MSDYTGLSDDPLEHDPAADIVATGRTERQQAIAALITKTIIANGIDSDAVSVHATTISYQIIDSLREAGLAITRKR